MFIPVTGPKLLSGDLIAKDASKALGVDMKFDDVSEYVTLLTYEPRPAWLGADSI